MAVGVGPGRLAGNMRTGGRGAAGGATRSEPAPARKQENRKYFTDARGAGDGEQENGIWQENRKRDAARGDGEQQNGIWQENK